MNGERLHQAYGEYRVSCYKLGTLQAVFDMEHVNQFLKMIGRIDKEDCAIDLRYKMFIYV